MCRPSLIAVLGRWRVALRRNPLTPGRLSCIERKRTIMAEAGDHRAPNFKEILGTAARSAAKHLVELLLQGECQRTGDF